MDRGVALPAIWRDRDLAFLVSGEFASQMGSQVLFLLLPWLALARTGDAALAGLAVSAYGLPNALLGLLLGPFVDRAKASRILVASAWLMGLALGGLLALTLAGGLTPARLVGASFVLGCLAAPSRGAVGALVPRLVEARAAREGRALERKELDEANALASGILRASLVVGPALGGALIAWLGPEKPLGVASLGLLVGGALYLFVREARPPRAAKPNLARELGEGLRHLVGEPFVLRVAAFVFVFDATFNAALDIALPAYVQTAFGDARVLGFAASAFGAGALAGALFYKPLGEGKFHGAWLALRLAPAPVVFALPMLTPSPWPLYVGMLAAGVLIQPLNIVLASRMQARTPPEKRGRVLSAFYAASALAVPLAVFASGQLVARFGARAVLAGLALVAALAAVPFLLSRVVQRELANA